MRQTSALLLILAGLIFAGRLDAQTEQDQQARRAACDALFDSLDSPSVAADHPGAIRDLLAIEPERQIGGLEALAAAGDPAVIPWIATLVDSPDPEVRLHAGLALKQVVEGVSPGEGARDLQPLGWVVSLMLAQPDDGRVHAQAAKIIRHLELKDMVPELRRLLRSLHPAVTRTARWALAELGHPAPSREGTELPLSYQCERSSARIEIDGRLDDAAWTAATWTGAFVDIQGDKRPAPRFRTRLKMLWDDEFLYIGAEMEEPQLWAELTAHDSVIYHENDFEVFIDPEGDNLDYGEFEINALGTYWDLRLTRPYRDGGNADNSWEIPGLKSAVHVDGTVNDPSDVDRGWSLELAFPWQGFRDLRREGVPAQPASFPPKPGDVWRLNFSRVQWRREVVDGRYRKLDQREDNWVWTPQGAIDMHRPETWGFLRF